MTENQVGFLYKAAASLQLGGENKNLTLLRSYYLMRCKDITKGYGLPEKHFSTKVRCSKCCIEWNKQTDTKVKAIKLSKKQRQRIRSQKSKKGNKELVEKRKQLLTSNEIEQICSFCKQSTNTTAEKPEKIEDLVKPVSKTTPTPTKLDNIMPTLKSKTAESTNSKKSDKKHKTMKNTQINVYSVSKDIFSMKNKKNYISNKEEAKVIKNNKKKKNKYAGLCERAVLATAKMKQEKDKQNKLNLFLKPST
ncbi:hypothetical protein O0L34_g14177 [Tuta absoluta]|nr:hypothetical protein O0L34_g14177 [Tuta absoluta]